MVRQSGKLFYFKPKEAAAALKVTKKALRDVVVKMGGETGKNFRVPITDDNATRCFCVATTPSLSQAFEGNCCH